MEKFWQKAVSIWHITSLELKEMHAMGIDFVGLLQLL